MPRAYALLVVLSLSFAATSLANEKLKGIACRSVHLAYQAEKADAFYNELTPIESSDGTYFMACGWSKGYFGIQELANGKKLVIFSIWDPAGGDNPASVPEEKRVKLLHQDKAVRVKRFGNEGTGGQSFFDYDWKLKEAYRFMVTAKPDGDDRTAYSGYFYVPEEKAWKHLVTFSTLTEKNEQLRGYYSFIEDFRRNKISTTKVRRADFTNGWTKSLDGKWHPLTKARFTADANPVLNIDAGAQGAKFFLATGGDTENKTSKLRDLMTREGGEKEPPTDLPNQ